MTSHLPLNQILSLLDQANVRDPNIRITPSVGTRVDFLDVSANNHQGQLETTVFHKSAAEPYVVPFRSDHPRRIHRNIIRGALYRAVRVCSHVEDFNTERLNIELTLLLNGYPPRFIAYHFKRFLIHNHAISLMDELNNELYMKIHHELLYQLTHRERRQQEHQAATTSIKTEKEIRVCFTFESGPMLHFKKDLTRLWREYYVFKGSPMNNVILKISTRMNRSLNELLAPKKPSKTLLR